MSVTDRVVVGLWSDFLLLLLMAFGRSKMVSLTAAIPWISGMRTLQILLPYTSYLYSLSHNAISNEPAWSSSGVAPPSSIHSSLWRFDGMYCLLASMTPLLHGLRET